jgi:F420-dependent methylenetetrahydromethanopterin dehydrogenase
MTDQTISAVFRGRLLNIILIEKNARSQIDINMIVLILKLKPKTVDHLREMMAKIPRINAIIVNRNSQR